MKDLKDAVQLLIVIIILSAVTATAIITVQVESLNDRLEQKTSVAKQSVASDKKTHTASTHGLIKARCDEKGVDYNIALAIARAETGNFTSKAYKQCNNVGGMSINETPISYTTLQDGVNAFVDNLADNYFAKGHNTIAKISKKYCPANHDKWTNLVEELANDTTEEVRV